MEIKQFLKECNFEFKKKFGQNFITDTNLLESICDDAELTKDDEVLEIGVGAGTLTKVISSIAKKVVGYEIDSSLKEVLSDSLKGAENTTIIFKDFLRTEASDVNGNFDGKYKVVANLPYYITSNIIFKLIEENFNVESLTLMVQREVADRLTSLAGTKDYGTITVELDSVGDVKIARYVDRKMFSPQPNVDSAVINIKLKKDKYKINDMKLHQSVIKAGFSMRRKTLSNCLKSNFGFSQSQIEFLFEKLNFDKNIRGEALSTRDYVALSNAIFDMKKTV